VYHKFVGRVQVHPFILPYKFLQPVLQGQRQQLRQPTDNGGLTNHCVWLTVISGEAFLCQVPASAFSAAATAGAGVPYAVRSTVSGLCWHVSSIMSLLAIDTVLGQPQRQQQLVQGSWIDNTVSGPAGIYHVCVVCHVSASYRHSIATATKTAEAGAGVGLSALRLALLACVVYHVSASYRRSIEVQHSMYGCGMALCWQVLSYIPLPVTAVGTAAVTQTTQHSISSTVSSGIPARGCGVLAVLLNQAATTHHSGRVWAPPIPFFVWL
jgi:hypothetical protein